MEKHTVIVLCAVTSCACTGAGSSMRMYMVWLHAAFQLLAQMELELVSVEGCSLLVWNQLALYFPPRCFESHLKEITDSTISSPLDRIRQVRALEQITTITISLALQELFFHNSEAPGSCTSWTLAVLEDCVWWVNGGFGVQGWVNAQVTWGKEGTRTGRQKLVEVWFYRALFYFCLIRGDIGDFTMQTKKQGRDTDQIPSLAQYLGKMK